MNKEFKFEIKMQEGVIEFKVRYDEIRACIRKQNYITLMLNTGEEHLNIPELEIDNFNKWYQEQSISTEKGIHLKEGMNLYYKKESINGIATETMVISEYDTIQQMYQIEKAQNKINEAYKTDEKTENKYRLVELNESLIEGDECLDKYSGIWHKVHLGGDSEHKGKPIGKHPVCQGAIYRRKV